MARRGKSLHTPQKALRARRAPQTVRWTVCSQSGDQFIIATRGFKPGTQPQVSRRLFCFFFLRLKKEDNGQPRTSVPTIRKQAFIFSLTKKSVAGFGTQPQVSRRLFCFFFLRLKKEDNGQPRTSVPTVRKQAFIFSHTKRALRGLGHNRKCPNDFFASFFFA